MCKIMRAVSVLLALAAVLCLVSCKGDSVVAGTPAEGLVGKWCYYPNEAVHDIITDVIVDPNVYVKLFYEFYEDGTGVTYLSTDDTKMEFTYSFDGETLTISGKDGTFDTPATLSGNILSVYDLGTKEYRDLKKEK